MNRSWLVVVQSAILLMALCLTSRSYSCHYVAHGDPIAELLYLEPILRKLFIEDDFSFTLFGNKPMSFTGLTYDDPQYPLGEVVLKQSRSCNRSYDLFEHWVHSLPTEHYCFVLNKGTEDTVMVYLIHKRCFLNAVRDNLDLFQKELGSNVTPEGLLNRFQHDSQSVFEILKYREGLLGILLGYGRHNAMLFQKKEDLIGPLSGYQGRIAHPSYHLMRHPKSVSSNSAIWNSKTHSKESVRHQHELEALEEKLQSFADEWIDVVLMPVRLPGFAADQEHEETKALERGYREVLPKILQAYAKQPLCQAILEQMSREKD